jgi:hypothetical protein
MHLFTYTKEKIRKSSTAATLSMIVFGYGKFPKQGTSGHSFGPKTTFTMNVQTENTTNPQSIILMMVLLL